MPRRALARETLLGDRDDATDRMRTLRGLIEELLS
jgi:hypothetical protein